MVANDFDIRTWVFRITSRQCAMHSLDFQKTFAFASVASRWSLHLSDAQSLPLQATSAWSPTRSLLRRGRRGHAAWRMCRANLKFNFKAIQLILSVWMLSIHIVFVCSHIVAESQL